MNFDKFLVLNIITYCSYRDIIRWKRLNKFFHSAISDSHAFVNSDFSGQNLQKYNNSSFWELYKQRRCNPVSYKVKYIDNDFLKRGFVKKYDSLDDIYDVIGHFLLNNIEKIDCMEFKMDNVYYFLYQSPKFVWGWHSSNIRHFNEYRSENDGLGEGDYDEETGLPNYYNDLIDEPEFDDSYKSIASIDLHRFFKEEDTAFVEAEPNYRMNYQCPTIDRRSVIGALPDNILGKIFSYAYFEGKEINIPTQSEYRSHRDLQTPLLYLVSKKFNRIFLKHVYPPYSNACKGILHACRKDHLSYFNKWKSLAGNRLDIQEAFKIAFIYKSNDILNSMDSITLSKENLKLICLDTNMIKKLLPNIHRDNIPEMIFESKRIGNNEAISLLRQAYNTKLVNKTTNKNHLYLI